MRASTLVFALALALPASAQAKPKQRATILEEISWVEAEKRLRTDAVVVMALGAAAKEHGPHLKLGNDFVMAEYFKHRIAERVDVVIAPTINYSFYPAFVDYPGSTSLSLSTARDMVVDICRGLSRFGPRRFYILNTGVSTVVPLRQAASALAKEGILLQFFDWQRFEPLLKSVRQQARGTHADEIETSIMLYIAPSSVDMKRAVKDLNVEKGPGPLTRDPTKTGSYSPTGVFGDATLATREKGKHIAEGIVEGIVKEIEALRRAAVPVAAPAPPPQ